VNAHGEHRAASFFNAPLVARTAATRKRGLTATRKRGLTATRKRGLTATRKRGLTPARPRAPVAGEDTG
jgi:hypothetical protein